MPKVVQFLLLDAGRILVGYFRLLGDIMKLIGILLTGAALLCAAIPLPAFAWGKTGHRIVANIADDNLSGLARARVKQILGEERLADAANWPDEMRSSHENYWRRIAGPLHYVTVREATAYADNRPPVEGDAVTALAGFRQTLLNEDATAEERKLALRFALHIIGDLHQPLHAGNGTDRGGNQVKVEFFSQETNLHRVWDTHMVDREGLSYSEYSDFLEKRLTPDAIVKWTDPNPNVWIAESTQLRDLIYPDNPKIGYSYVFKHRDAMEERLAMGGVRAAAWLNSVFAEARSDN